MPLLLIALAGLGVGAFAGAQIDDKLDNNTQPIDPRAPAKLPLIVQIPLVVGGATAAYFVVKKIIKKI